MKTSSNTTAERLLKALRAASGGALLYAFIATTPIPAPRPRMSKWGGVFYPKNYSDYLADCQTQFAATGHQPLEGDLGLVMEFVMTKARTSKMSIPRGDLDNLQKGVMDGATQAGTVWGDDQQVAALVATKRFAAPDEKPGIHFYWGALG